MTARDHSWKEDGRKKQRLHGIFLTRLLHLHLNSAVLEATEQDVPLGFEAVPNSQLLASGTLGLCEGTLSCEVSKAPQVLAACPQEPFMQGSSQPAHFGDGAMVLCKQQRELSSASSYVSDRGEPSFLQSQVNSRRQRRKSHWNHIPNNARIYLWF